jgi:hypothetical protein
MPLAGGCVEVLGGFMHCPIYAPTGSLHRLVVVAVDESLLAEILHSVNQLLEGGAGSDHDCPIA